MVHIDISTDTKDLLNKCRGLIQIKQDKKSEIITYDKTVKALCLLYLNSKEDGKNARSK